MSQPEIKQASSKDIPNIVDTVALAFAADPLVRWIYPDPNQYLSHIHKMTILFAGKAFDHGTVHYVEGYRGAALWLPPDIHPDEEALVAHMNNSILEPSREAVFAVFGQMEESHPNKPYWYLPVLAVEPFPSEQRGWVTAARTCQQKVRRRGHASLFRIFESQKYFSVQAPRIRSDYQNTCR